MNPFGVHEESGVEGKGNLEMEEVCMRRRRDGVGGTATVQRGIC